MQQDIHHQNNQTQMGKHVVHHQDCHHQNKAHQDPIVSIIKMLILSLQYIVDNCNLKVYVHTGFASDNSDCIGTSLV